MVHKVSRTVGTVRTVTLIMNDLLGSLSFIIYDYSLQQKRQQVNVVHCAGMMNIL